MSKVLIVGQAPSSDGAHRSSDRLIELVGCTEEEFWTVFEWKNLLKKFPGKNGKGDAFPMAGAKLGALAMMTSPKFMKYDRVILLGKNVGRAFGLQWNKYFETCGIMILFPHPSGVSRWWNDPENAKRAQTFLREVYHDGTAQNRSLSGR